MNGTCTVAVTFTPGGTGERDGLLQFAGIPCEPPQTLQLTGNGVAPSTPGATITPTSPIAFPNTAQAVASSPVTVTVTNSGNANLVISTVTVGGTNAGDFSLTANTCNGATVAANATCTVGVIFTPGALGVRMATLNVADNAPATPQSATLSGTGVAAAPVVSVTPTGGVNFPNTVQGQTATAIVQTITNTGNATLTLSSITKTGANPGDFAISQNTCTATLAVNANCQVSITFTPTTTGARTANLSIADNATGSPQLVSLTGTGTPVNAPVVTFTPSGTIGFPSTAQGSTSSPIAVTIGNTGGAILNISGIALGGTSAGDFAIASNNCGATLAASASCMVSLTFKPTATGVRTAALVVTDNAAGSPQMAVLSGTGTAAGAAAVSINPTAVSLSLPRRKAPEQRKRWRSPTAEAQLRVRMPTTSHREGPKCGLHHRGDSARAAQRRRQCELHDRVVFAPTTSASGLRDEPVASRSRKSQTAAVKRNCGASAFN